MQIYYDRNKKKIRVYDEQSDTDIYTNIVLINKASLIKLDKKSIPNCWLEVIPKRITKRKNSVTIE